MAQRKFIVIASCAFVVNLFGLQEITSHQYINFTYSLNSNSNSYEPSQTTFYPTFSYRQMPAPIPCPDGQQSMNGNCFDCGIGTYSNRNTNYMCAYCPYAMYTGAANCQPGYITTVSRGYFNSGMNTESKFTLLRGMTIWNEFVYFVDSCTIKSMSIMTSNVSVLAGNYCMYYQVDGDGSSAFFYQPTSIIANQDGILFVADYDTLRCITLSGYVTTVAGKSGLRNSSDGFGLMARFNQILDTTLDLNGIIYVLEVASNSQSHRIRTVDPHNFFYVQTVVIYEPSASTPYPISCFTFTEKGILVGMGNNTIFSVTSTEESYVAGTPGAQGTQDGRGLMAGFGDAAIHMASDINGGVLLTQAVVFPEGNPQFSIRSVSITGETFTLARGNPMWPQGDGFAATQGAFYPYDIKSDINGTIYIIDSSPNNLIRKLSTGCPPGEYTNSGNFRNCTKIPTGYFSDQRSNVIYRHPTTSLAAYINCRGSLLAQGSTFLSFNLSLSSQIDGQGSLYCLATAVKSKYQSNTNITFNLLEKIHVVTITNLKPSTAYQINCVVDMADGRSQSITSNSVIIFSTLNETNAWQSNEPSSLPSHLPSEVSTQNPTITPSNNPSEIITLPPTVTPSVPPTISPLNYPTMKPTIAPTASPTIGPSNFPSTIPTLTPTIPIAQPLYSTGTNTFVDSSNFLRDSSWLYNGSPAYVVSNGSPSYISVASDSNAYPGDYTYTTSFTLEGYFVNNGIEIFGLISNDDTTIKISLNGVNIFPYEYTCCEILRSFSITAQPLAQNILSVTVNNAGVNVNPTNLEVIIENIVMSSPTLEPTMSGARITAVPALSSTKPTSLLPTTNPSLSPSLKPTFSTLTLAPSKASSHMPTNSTSKAPSIKPTSTLTINPSTAPSILAPTKSPSLFPSAKPALNGAIQFSVLNVTKLGKSDLTIVVSIVSVIDSSGTLFCAATANIAIPLTASYIQSFGTPIIFLSLSQRFDMVLHSLMPSTNYMVNCYVSLSDGRSTVSPSPVKIQTACCKAIVFTNSPASVYGDPNMYAGSSNPTNFIFSFTLSSAPASAIVITPLFNRTSLEPFSNSYQQIRTYPNSYYVTNTSYLGSAQALSFYIQAPKSLTGVYQLNLVVTGSSANQYAQLTSTFVNILSTSSPLPAPRLISARLSSGGTNIIIQFDAATDYAGITSAQWACNQLFFFQQSDTSTCSWVNSSAVLVALLSSSTIVPGVNITLFQGLLRQQCTVGYVNCNSNIVSTSQTISLLQPFNPIIPTINILPVSIGSCDKLVIDATSSTGSAGRPFLIIHWNITKNGRSIALIQDFLNSFNAIDKPITIPPSMITAGSYLVTLSLSNYLGYSGSGTSSIFVNPSRFSPTVSILGQRFITIRPSAQLSVQGIATPSACHNSTVSLTFQYLLYFLDGTVAPNITSTSRDPSQFILPGYALAVGTSYILVFNVSSSSQAAFLGYSTASIKIFVAESVVVASVAGGYSRVVPIDQALQLDASTSRDFNLPPNVPQLLHFAWTCYIQLPIGRFGSHCDIPNVFNSSTNLELMATVNSTLLIPSFRLDLNVTYMLTLSVFSPDKRYNSISVKLQTSRPGSPIITPTVGQLSVNENEMFTLGATVRANYSITMVWNLYLDSTELNLNAASSPLRTFPATEASKGISFPLLISSSSLLASRIYTFKISAYPSNYPDLQASANIPVKVMAPPMYGSVTSSLSHGYAMQTLFSFSATGWISEDPTGYPLSYSFSYQLSSSSFPTTIVSGSQLSTITTTLPLGYGSLGYNVTVIVTAYNSFGGFSTSRCVVKVLLNDSISVGSVVSSGLAIAFATGNIDKVYQTIGSAVSVYNSVSCTLAPNCIALNRQSCTTIPNTCGECIIGFVGISTPSNTPCTLLNEAKLAGSSCLVNIECLYHSCIGGVCQTPSKTCPSNETYTICSGRGSCVYTLSTGQLGDNCLVTDTNCKYQCQCRGGFAGIDCSLSMGQVQERQSTKISMCEALSITIEKQNFSPALVTTILGMISQVYSPYDTVSYGVISSCQSLFLTLSQLVSLGYLSDAQVKSSQLFLNTVTNFVTKPAGRHSNTTIAVNSDYVDQFISNFHQGFISSSMVAGSLPISLTSEGVNVLLRYDYLHSLENATFSSVVGNSSLKLPPSGLSHCAFEDNQAKTSLTDWSTYPYDDSNATSSKAPLLRFSAIQPAVANQFSTSATALEVKFWITLQFSPPQNFTAMSNSKSVSKHIPQCIIWNYLTQSFDPCSQCNISYMSPTHVTYECRNISQLCTGYIPAPIQSKRQLVSASKRAVTTTVRESSTTFGTTVLELSHEIQTVTNQNPFIVDPNGSKGVIIFVGILVLLVFGGLLFFMKWDQFDRRIILKLDTTPANNSNQSFSRWDRLFIYLESTSNIAPVGISKSQGMTTFYNPPRVESKVIRTMMHQLDTSNFDITDEKDLVKALTKSKERAAVPTSLLKGGTVPHLQPNALRDSLDTAISSVISKSISVEDSKTEFDINVYDATTHANVHHEGDALSIYNLAEGTTTNKKKSSSSKKKKSLQVTIMTPRLRYTAIYSKPTNLKPSNVDSNPLMKSTKTSFIVSKAASKRNQKIRPPSTSNFNQLEVESLSNSHSTGRDLTSHCDSDVIFQHYSRPECVDDDPISLAFPVICNDNVENIDDSICEFLSKTMPAFVFEPQSSWSLFCTAVLSTHTYTSMFAGPSLTYSRTLRHTKFCQSILLILFINTLFFKIAYPDDGSCEVITDETTCASYASAVTSENLCAWSNNNNSCSFNSVNNGFEFTIIISLCTILISFPLDIVLSFMLQEICSKQPDLTIFGIALDDPSHSTTSSPLNVKDCEPAISNFDKTFDAYFGNKSNSAVPLVPERVNMLPANLTSTEFVTPGEEADYILNEAKLHQNGLTAMNAVLEQPCGISGFLQFLDKIRYKALERKAEAKIKRSKSIANALRKELTELPQSQQIYKSAILTQQFIKEQLSFEKRYCYEKFCTFGEGCVDTINPIAWFLSWAMIIGSMCYFLYFIYDWGVISGGSTFNQWGTNFGLSIVQDVVFVRLLRIYVDFVYGTTSLRPQLISIFKVLANVALRVLEASSSGAVSNLNEGPSELRLCQHFYPSCRVAHFLEFESLPAARILRNIDDSDIDKCKSGYNVRLTGLSSLVILVPAAIAMLYKPMADTFLELALPSFVSSALLVYATLYAISLTAVVALNVVIIAILVYYNCVYIPARLRVIQSRSHSNHQVASLVDKVIYAVSIEGLSAFCTICSNVFAQPSVEMQFYSDVESSKRGKVENDVLEDLWIDMDDDDRKMALKSLKSLKSKRFKSSKATSSKKRGLCQSSKSVSKATSKKSLREGVMSWRPNHYSSFIGPLFSSPALTMDEAVAIKRMLFRYIEKNFKKSSREGIAKSMDCLTFQHEKVLLADLWKYYFPNGHKLSILEQQDFLKLRKNYRREYYRFKLFDEFRSEFENETIFSNIPDSDIFELEISYKLFRVWLLEQLEELVTRRQAMESGFESAGLFDTDLQLDAMAAVEETKANVEGECAKCDGNNLEKDSVVNDS